MHCYAILAFSLTLSIMQVKYHDVCVQCEHLFYPRTRTRKSESERREVGDKNESIYTHICTINEHQWAYESTHKSASTPTLDESIQIYVCTTATNIHAFIVLLFGMECRVCEWITGEIPKYVRRKLSRAHIRLTVIAAPSPRLWS